MEDMISNRYVYQNYRIKLHGLRDDQKQHIKEMSDARRFLYNWALEYSDSVYQNTGKTPSYQAVARVFTELKKTNPLFTWLDDPKYPVTMCRYAFVDLHNAYHNFINGKCNRPIFKKRKTDSIRIAVRSDCLTFKKPDYRYAFIPGLSTKKGDLIDCGNHHIPQGVKYENTRIKFDGVDYWLSFSVKMELPFQVERKIDTDDIVGIDVGIRTTATLSNGITYDGISNRHRLQVLDARLRHQQTLVDADIKRRLDIAARTRTKYVDVPKSNNQLKREANLAKTRHRIRNIYRSYYHKVSRSIANAGYNTIVIEDLSASAMVQNAEGRARRNNIYNSRLATLTEFIHYKCMIEGTNVILADRNYPSSQLCSACGQRTKVGKEKTYICPYCSAVIDRDVNAAINLQKFGYNKLTT